MTDAKRKQHAMRKPLTKPQNATDIFLHSEQSGREGEREGREGGGQPHSPAGSHFEVFGRHCGFSGPRLCQGLQWSCAAQGIGGEEGKGTGLKDSEGEAERGGKE